MRHFGESKIRRSLFASVHDNIYPNCMSHTWQKRALHFLFNAMTQNEMVICEALACLCEQLVKQRFLSSPSSWLKVTSMAMALCSVLIVTWTVNLRTIVPKLWLCTSHKYIIFSVPSFSHVHFNILQSCSRLFCVASCLSLVSNTPFWMRQGVPFFLSKGSKFERCQVL